MALDRDLGVCVLDALGSAHALRGWEMTAATGVRGLRLAAETDAFRSLLLTETGAAAFELLRANCAEHSARGTRAVLWDARRPLARGAFDYVDLDPYGTPVPFAESLLHAVRPGGVVAVTATDLAVLAGAVRGAAVARYGGRPVRGRLGPEGGVRLLLAYFSRRAADTGRTLVPLLAYVLGHHVRFYAQLRPGRPSSLPVATIPGPDWVGPTLPGGGPFGPLWLGPLFDPAFVGRLRPTSSAARPRELRTLLQRLVEESRADAPFTYEPNEIARELRLRSPPGLSALISGLRSAGFPAARSHVRPSAVRTCAPRAVVHAVVRQAVA